MTDMPEQIWAEEFFWPNVLVLGNDECWMWLGTKMGRGYGSIRPRKGASHTGAHRFSWALHNKKWPCSSEVIMHSCDNPSCVNPAHLSAGSQRQNIQDCVGKGRHKPFVPPLKELCANGHRYTDQTTRWAMSRGRKYRRCRVCDRAANQIWMKSNDQI